jgi:hypothetical protein
MIRLHHGAALAVRALEARMAEVRYWVQRGYQVATELTRDIDAYYANTTSKSTIINYASTEESTQNEDWFRDSAREVRYG